MYTGVLFCSSSHEVLSEPPCRWQAGGGCWPPGGAAGPGRAGRGGSPQWRPLSAAPGASPAAVRFLLRRSRKCSAAAVAPPLRRTAPPRPLSSTPGPEEGKGRGIFSLFSLLLFFFPLMNSVKFGQLTVVLPAAGGGTPIREEKNSEKVNLRRAYTHSPSAASDPSSPQLRVPMPESSSERQEKLRALVRQCCRGSSRDSVLSGGGLEGGRGRIR